MNQEDKEKIIEEWYKEVSENSNIGLYRRDIADWWLAKLEEAKKEATTPPSPTYQPGLNQ